MGIESGGYKDKVGLVCLKTRLDQFVEYAPISYIAHVWRERDVERVISPAADPNLVHSPNARIEIGCIKMGGDKQNGIIFKEDVLGAVAMMHIEIDDRHPFGLVCHLSLARGHGRVRAEVAASDAVSDLHADPNGRGGTLLTAVEARQQKFSEENRPETNTEQISVSNLDAERARMQAISALRKSSREFLTAEINTVGFAALRPGKHVALSGFYAPFDGIYYVTSADHTLNASGHRTKCSLRRPGMLDPADYPAE